MVCHYFDKIGGHRYCTCTDKRFLFCHVIKEDHVGEGSGGCNNRSSSK